MTIGPPGGSSQPPPPATPPLGGPGPETGGPPVAGGPSDGPGRRADWGPADIVLGIVLVLGAVIFGGLIVFAIAGTSGLDATIGSQLVLEAAFFGTALYFASRNRSVRAGIDALGLRRPAPGWGGPTALAFLGYLAFAIAFTQFVARPEQTNVADDLGFGQSTIGAIVAAILIVIVAPIAEETFFRGFVFGGLRSRLPFLAAAVISGLIFGSVHLTTGNVAAAFQLSVLGAVLAWLYERTGSIETTIAVHMVNNALAFTVLVST